MIPTEGDLSPADPNATVTIADEVAEVVQDAITAAETFTNAAVKVPFSTARLAVEKLRSAADMLETQLRKAASGAKGGSK